jgi:uncharacterized membrane protein YgdD (TMEM256/DUF423 family)
VDAREAGRGLDLIRDVIARTRRRLDPHAFHFVHWGAIVLVWYPVATWLTNEGRLGAMAAVGGASIVLGFALSFVRELRLRDAPRLAGGDPSLTRQVGVIVAGNVAAGMLLSSFGPATGVIDGPDVPIVWGLVYANLAFTTGVLYAKDFLVSGVVIFAGTLVAMLVQPYGGYVLGPVMGLGMIVPGRRAEARVRRLAEEERGLAAAGEV